MSQVLPDHLRQRILEKTENTIPFPKPKQTPLLPPLDVISASSFAGIDIPDRAWLLDGILIRRGITLLTGDGGIGKSLLCLQLQVACALGKPWLGIPIDNPISSFGLYCEDEREEVHRRVADILKYYDATFDDLGDRMMFVCRVGHNNVMMRFDRSKDQLVQTPFMQQIIDEIEMGGYQITIIDTVADTFQGNENDRMQTRSFVSATRVLGHRYDGGVILSAHPSRAGMADGSGLSGSTAWHNSCRGRIYLTKPPKDPHDPDFDDDKPTNERILKKMKNNYGAADGKMRLEWKDGAFVRTDNRCATTVEAYAHDKAVLDACRWLVERGEAPLVSYSGRTAMISLVKHIPTCGLLSMRELIGAQERLIERKELEIVDVKQRRCVRPVGVKILGEP